MARSRARRTCYPRHRALVVVAPACDDSGGECKELLLEAIKRHRVNPFSKPATEHFGRTVSGLERRTAKRVRVSRTPGGRSTVRVLREDAEARCDCSIGGACFAFGMALHTSYDFRRSPSSTCWPVRDSEQNLWAACRRSVALEQDGNEYVPLPTSECGFRTIYPISMVR